MTSDHGRAHECREQVSDPLLINTRTSVAAEMAVDPRTDWQTIHEPKGGERVRRRRGELWVTGGSGESR